MFLYSKLSLAILLILVITGVAYINDILDQKYVGYVFLIGLFAQSIILMLVVMRILVVKDKLKRGIKIIRYKMVDTYIEGGKYMIPEYIAPTNPTKPSMFKIFIEADNFGELPCFIMCKMGKGNYDIKQDESTFNAKRNIEEKSFIFDADILVGPDEKINCKFKDDINIKMFFIGELYIP